MVRKTREQVWRELDALGEEEVRERLAARPEDVGEAGLVREWLDEKVRVAAELASTREASDPSKVPSSVPEAMAARSGLDPRTVGIMGIFLLGILYTLVFRPGVSAARNHCHPAELPPEPGCSRAQAPAAARARRGGPRRPRSARPLGCGGL
jgi:hypothetical protein